MSRYRTIAKKSSSWENLVLASIVAFGVFIASFLTHIGRSEHLEKSMSLDSLDQKRHWAEINIDSFDQYLRQTPEIRQELESNVWTIQISESSYSIYEVARSENHLRFNSIFLGHLEPHQFLREYILACSDTSETKDCTFQLLTQTHYGFQAKLEQRDNGRFTQLPFCVLSGVLAANDARSLSLKQKESPLKK